MRKRVRENIFLHCRKIKFQDGIQLLCSIFGLSWICLVMDFGQVFLILHASGPARYVSHSCCPRPSLLYLPNYEMHETGRLIISKVRYIYVQLLSCPAQSSSEHSQLFMEFTLCLETELVFSVQCSWQSLSISLSISLMNGYLRQLSIPCSAVSYLISPRGVLAE